MRTERFKGGLLSALVIASLMVPVVAATLILSTSSVSASPNGYDIIIRGKDTAYNVDITGDAPWVWYVQGDRPPIMVAERVGLGAVIAAGTASTCRGGITSGAKRWVSGEWDVLLDKEFQWMVPGATKVLWYGEYGFDYNVYHDAARCSWLIDALGAKGYAIDNTMDGTATPIDASLLSPYDILVIPQLEPGERSTGGDPALLPDAEVSAIKTWVESGHGLLIMDQTDYFGYNYYKVQNKILRALNMGIYFQMDSVLDDINNRERSHGPVVDVNPGSEIGAAYQAATGKTIVGLWEPSSLAEPGHGVSFFPKSQEGLQGWTLEWTVKILNMSEENNTYSLTVSDNENWGPWLEDNLLTVPAWEIGSVALAITIPPDAGMGAEDNILVTATSAENVEESNWCIAHVGIKVPPTDDVHVAEGNPTGNSGDMIFMYVGSSSTTPWLDERVFLKFDLSAIPADMSIVSTKLYLNCYSSRGSIPERNLQVRSVDNDNWNEMTITWDNQPSYENVLDTRLVPAGNARYSWDVTSFVQEQQATDNLVSFSIRAENENLMGPDNFYCGFHSKELGVVAHHPYLELEMQAYTPTGENVQVTPMPGLTATFTIVENSGITTVTTSTDGPPPPTAYEVVGIAGQPIYYDITTTATYSESINVCISYVETQVLGAEENLKLIQKVDNFWEDITTSVDTENDKIYGTTTTLSIFIVMGPPWTGTADFSLVNLYTVNLEKNLYLENGSKLVVKFYTYGDAYENENVIESFVPPAHVEENESARHPEDICVKKARLDLTTDNTENVISTIASFTVTKAMLEARFMDIPFWWSQADPAGKLDLESEFMWIPFCWSGAPP